MIIWVRRPRRRWVGATVTLVRAADGTSDGPGTVRGVGKDRSVPTTVDPSKAPHVRVRSMSPKR